MKAIGCLHVLRANANRNHAVAKPARKGSTLQEPEKPWEPCWSRVAEATPHDSFLDQRLHALRDPGGERAAVLYFRKIARADSTFAKGSRQDVGRSNGVLNGKIDPDAPHRRHGVSRIAD